MKFIAKYVFVLFAVLLPLAAQSTFKNDVRVYQADNSKGYITPGGIEKAFKDEGFVIGANNDMNRPFKRDFGKTHMDVYNLMVAYRKDTVAQLAEKYPEIGLFMPISMSIYTPKGAKTISVATLRVEVMADMMHIPRDNPAIVKLGEKIEAALKRAMPNGKFIDLPYRSVKPEQETVTRYTFALEGNDIEDAKDAFEERFEEEMSKYGFVMASFTDLGYELEEKNIDAFDFYDVYSICKIPVIYEVSKLHPEAGAFAPCSAYIYRKKGQKEVHFGFPNVYKWLASLHITDKASRDVLIDAQEKFEKVLKALQEEYRFQAEHPGNGIKSSD